MKAIQAFVATHPKAGATWLRFLLAQYLSIAHNERYVLTLKNMTWFVPYRPPQKDAERYLFDDRSEIPLVCFSHNMPDFPEYGLSNKVVLLLRHPFALVVSRFFHVAHHAPDPAAGSNTDIFEFAMKGRDGLANTRGFLNGWAAAIKKRNGFVLTYEQMNEDISAAFTRFLTYCEIPIDRAALVAAIEASDKAHMIDAERRDPFNLEAEHDGRKARVHFVGRYDDYFSVAQQREMREVLMSGLTPDAHEMLRINGLLPQIFDLDELIARQKETDESLAANPIMRN